MPTLNELIKKREEAAEKAEAATRAQVRILQAIGYTALIEWVIGNIETEDGRIVYSSKNLGKVAGIYRAFGAFQNEYKGTMLGKVLEWAGRIFGANQDYFESFKDVAEGVTDKARRLTLQRWGYDGKNLIPGGYFESLFNNQAIAQRVARLMNQAILQKMPLKEFQKTFKVVFVGSPGQGMLERHWRTNSFDLYMRLDRTANLIYADELGLDWAIYSGTLEEDSRPFCIARVNRVFNRPEMLAWKDLEFSGKPKIGYEPLLDCGGHNCRHHLSWISEGLAETLKAKRR